MNLTLTQRLAIVFAVLLLVCSGTSAWLQLRSNRMHELEVVQALSRDVAESIARDAQLTDANGLMPNAVRNLFNQLMMVNPSVEVYLLEPDGRIAGHAAPEGRLRRDRVDLEPVHRFIDGQMLPILGDDPRSRDGRKVFSAAPLSVNGRQVGFIYVVLLGEAHDLLAARGSADAVLKTALLSIGMVGLLCLAAGLVAFTLITRPLRRLTESVRQFDMHGAPPEMPERSPDVADHSRDEIAVLDAAYRQMVLRISEQWEALTRQDQERRELIANISHDLRTPLSSLHGYLETMLLKDASLEPAERRRYLGIALDQSRRVGALSQSLFELARLEYGFVQPELESFSLVDLVQDVFQKFELAAESRHIALQADLAPQLPAVRADLGMIERVLSNLLDNALRYTPEGGVIRIAIRAVGQELEVTISDSGLGIPQELREGLFRRPFTVGGARRDGGLGLRIVHQMLELHGVSIHLVESGGQGTTFRFSLPRTPA
ncbi:MULTISPECIES: sensor histidine kinase [Comamonas]|uniref:sensor histidine kinase n=1 Tax=Comamonas TaxID=283 RepID=UPI00050DA82E|nr:MULTISPECIES: HAMP domain-containing sensor histidine kinase [Comamonas]KGG93829.1 sensor histidine kinase [Comamonas thiooxydans]KGG99776.1 sensor histidine kinase [Comamonas thiooxydans]KGH05824.1 sensor histidine kinase [Comamonas thiooxydans]KGH14467.1 sensor histidine kinase [Comamonas thiooxydans]TZG09526.1 HAMP domain-containing histidine kinase [Comamonas thiooxydans]